MSDGRSIFAVRRWALAGALSALALAAGAPASLAAKGWGPEASYLGRYDMRVTGGGSAASAARSAVFSAVVQACLRLTSSAENLPKGGELTMFRREVAKSKPLVPSGILLLRTADDNELVYLTYLSSNDGRLSAKVNGGAFVGPVIGSFSGRLTGSGAISGSFTIEGLGTIEADFTRFSTSPQP